MWFRLRVSDPLSHVTHWSFDHVILKNALSPPSLGKWSPILAKCDLSWVDHNHRVTWLIYHVITLYLYKGTSPVSQRQWPSNLVGLWVRAKEPYLLSQVNWRSSDHVLFEKRQVSTKAKPQNSAGDIKHRITHKSKAFFVIQKISKLCKLDEKNLRTRPEEFYCLHNDNIIISFCKMVDFVEKYWTSVVSIA